MEIQKQTSYFGILKTTKNRGKNIYLFIYLGHIGKEKNLELIKTENFEKIGQKNQIDLLILKEIEKNKN
jgi:hypothetical protein